MTPALEALSRGDEAWWHDRRGVAVAEYRQAVALAGGGEGVDRAAEAMARLRLERLGGSLAPLWQERAINAALALCPDSEPWCAIAAADWELFMPAFSGANPTNVAEILRDSPLAGPAAARRVRAGAPWSELESVEATDGMGRAMVATHLRQPPFPGTWVLGVGAGGARGAGVGFVVKYSNPDVGWRAHRVDLLAGADTRGGGFISTQLTTHTQPAVQASALAAHAVIDHWVDDIPYPSAWTAFRVSGGVAPRAADILVQTGVLARWDNGLRVGGGYGSVTIGKGTFLKLGGEVDVGDYFLTQLEWHVKATPDLWGGTLALHGGAIWQPTGDVPWFRQPSAGGAELLRGLPAGRYREASLALAQVEYRHPIWGPLHGAAFVDAAAIEGLHFTVGGGLRLVLPPEKDNITRIDVGFGEDTWGVVVGWGDAF